MAVKDKDVQFISKLVELTRDKELAWRVERSPKDPASAAYVASIQGRELRIYRYSEQVPNPDYEYYARSFHPGAGLASILRPAVEPPKTRLRGGVVLEVLEPPTPLVVYTFEGKTGLSDLYESAAYSASKVEDLMDSVLRPEPAESRQPAAGV